MDSEAFVNRLVNLGLTGYEARAYLALGGRGSFTAAEVSRASGLPRQRIYDVLASLVSKGLAIEHPGAVVKYAAMEPSAAIERLLDQRRAALTELESQASDMVDQLAPLYAAGRRQTDPLDYIEVLREPSAINARFDELQGLVQREMLVFTRPPYARRPMENPSGLQLVRDYEVRSMYEYSLFDDQDMAEGVRNFITAGEQARVVPELPMKLVIIDETLVMFGMQDPIANSQDLTIVVVEHPSLAGVLKKAFDAYWAAGQTFDQAETAVAELRSRSA